jgi:hypothetical protein
MKSEDFQPVFANDPPLEEDAQIYVTFTGADNHEGHVGKVDVFDSTRRESTLNRLFVGQWRAATVEMILPCNIRDLAVEADFNGVVVARVSDRKRNRPYALYVKRQACRPAIECDLETTG